MTPSERHCLSLLLSRTRPRVARAISASVPSGIAAIGSDSVSSAILWADSRRTPGKCFDDGCLSPLAFVVTAVAVGDIVGSGVGDGDGRWGSTCGVASPSFDAPLNFGRNMFPLSSVIVVSAGVVAGACGAWDACRVVACNRLRREFVSPSERLRTAAAMPAIFCSLVTEYVVFGCADHRLPVCCC